MHNSDPSGKM